MEKATRKLWISGPEKKLKETIKDYSKRGELPYFYVFPTRMSFIIDQANREYMIAVECDGVHWHRDAGKRKKILDKWRQRKLERLGWVFMRFTDEEIDKDVRLCCEKLKELCLFRGFKPR